MRQYADVLRHADFRRLWIGSAVSVLGDGMTFIALSWLVLSGPGGTARLGLLGVCYTAPVLLGGLAVGPLLDRFDKRAVLIADSLFRAIATAMVRRPLRQSPSRTGGAPRRSLAMLGRDRVIVATTFAFMAFNIAEGMLLIAAPWMAKHVWTDSAATLGLLMAALAAGELIGAALAGAIRLRVPPLLAIGLAQTAGALGFLALLAAPNRWIVALGFFAVGLFSAPMTVWAQSLRMRRIPPEIHGRAFALLRTMMQATPPIGSAAVTPLLVGALLGPAAMVMTAVAGVPALLLLRGRRVRSRPSAS
jgi:MFS family permease